MLFRPLSCIATSIYTLQLLLRVVQGYFLAVLMNHVGGKVSHFARTPKSFAPFFVLIEDLDSARREELKNALDFNLRPWEGG